MASTEPYFDDAACSPVKRNYAIPIDEYGMATLVCTDVKDGAERPPMKWECTSECRSLTDCEVNAILSPKPAHTVKPWIHLTVVAQMNTTLNLYTTVQQSLWVIPWYVTMVVGVSVNSRY